MLKWGVEASNKFGSRSPFGSYTFLDKETMRQLRNLKVTYLFTWMKIPWLPHLWQVS